MASIDWNSFLPEERGKALTSIAAVLVVLVGAGWALFSFGYTRGKDIGQDELAAYKAVNEAKLPELTSGLLSINKELRESLKVFERNKKLEEENASYQRQLGEGAKARADLDTKISELREQIGSAEARYKELKDQAEARDQELNAQIAKIMGDNRRFFVSEYQTEFLPGGRVFAVTSVYTSGVKLNFDNKTQEIALGGYIPMEIENKNCTLTLLSTRTYPSPSRAEFNFACKPK